MKRSWLLAVSLVLLLTVVALSGCSASSVAGAEWPSTLRVSLDGQQQGVEVTGQGKLTAIPDIATLRLGIDAQAASKTVPQMRNMPSNVLRGRVLGVDEDESFFVIRYVEEEAVTIAVNSNTKYFKLSVPRKVVALKRMRIEGRELTINLLPLGEEKGMPKQWPRRLRWLHRFSEKTSFEDIAIGDRVVVWLTPSEDAPVAKLVIVVQPVDYKRIKGTIDTVSDNSITINDGSPLILTHGENTHFILKGVTAVEPGQSALAIYNGTNMVAKLIIVYLKASD